VAHVAGNVELALRARGVGKAEHRQRTAELLETVHLSGFGGKRPHQLSGAMRHRVALARDADVLLMDDRFGALASMTRGVLLDQLDRTCPDRQLTVLFVTHNVQEAVRLGDPRGGAGPAGLAELLSGGDISANRSGKKVWQSLEVTVN
jgi:NitT/TauT family transport system ATP-binding protein